MTKEQLLDLLQLLSALESWCFAEKHMPPDYLHDQISASVEVLREEIMK